VHRGDEILRGFDDDVRAHLRMEMVARGIDLRLNETIQKIEQRGAQRCAFLSDGAAIEADQVMLAVGRTPSAKNIGLEAAGVKLARSGAIEVDEHSRSSVPSIYAVGDVTARVALTPVAIREGHGLQSAKAMRLPIRCSAAIPGISTMRIFRVRFSQSRRSAR